MKSVFNNLSAMETQKESARKGIMIVDDSKFARSILKDILKSEGFHVVGEAGDGLEAIEMLKEKKPECIFLDVAMPKMNGLETIPKILEVDPELLIIMCSVMGKKAIMEEAARIGAKEFVLKPYKKENIVGALATHLGSTQKTSQVISFTARKKQLIEEEELKAALKEEVSKEEALEAVFGKEEPVAGLEEKSLKEETLDVVNEQEESVPVIDEKSLREKTLEATVEEVKEVKEPELPAPELEENTLAEETPAAVIEAVEPVPDLEEEPLEGEGLEAVVEEEPLPPAGEIQYSFLWKNRFESKLKDVYLNKEVSKRISCLDAGVVDGETDALPGSDLDRGILLGMISAYMCLDNRLQHGTELFEKGSLACGEGIRLFAKNLLQEEGEQKADLAMSDMLKLSQNKGRLNSPKHLQEHLKETELYQAIAELVQGKGSRIIGQDDFKI